jgi:hypothetical protein
MGHKSWLVAAGILSAIAALLHLAVIWGGADWYRFFGAGEEMARAAERGSAHPALLTMAIAAVLAIWSAYAFSGAGLIGRLPLLRTALILISFIYLARALAPLPILLVRPWLASPFVLWSSAIVLIYGLTYAIGTWKAWPLLVPRSR